MWSRKALPPATPDPLLPSSSSTSSSPDVYLSTTTTSLSFGGSTWVVEGASAAPAALPFTPTTSFFSSNALKNLDPSFFFFAICSAMCCWSSNYFFAWPTTPPQAASSSSPIDYMSSRLWRDLCDGTSPMFLGCEHTLASCCLKLSCSSPFSELTFDSNLFAITLFFGKDDLESRKRLLLIMFKLLFEKNGKLAFPRLWKPKLLLLYFKSYLPQAKPSSSISASYGTMTLIPVFSINLIKFLLFSSALAIIVSELWLALDLISLGPLSIFCLGKKGNAS